MADSALLNVARASDVTIVADKDHTDPAIIDHVTGQLRALADSGVRHLYLEQDPQETSVEKMVRGNSDYDRLVAQAQLMGMQVHLCDDRSLTRAVNARYPAAAAYAEQHDYYLQDTKTLIANAPDAEQMRRYIEERTAADTSPERNAAIGRNIDHGLRQHPGEKAMVVLGAWHMEQRGDVDEGLRQAGHQVSTIEINSENTIIRSRGPDMPDFIARTEDGQAVTYKPTNPDATHMIPLRDGAEPPTWRREEPVTAPDPMAAALSASGVDLARLNLGTHDGIHRSEAQTGTMARVTTAQVNQPEQETVRSA